MVVRTSLHSPSLAESCGAIRDPKSPARESCLRQHFEGQILVPMVDEHRNHILRRQRAGVHVRPPTPDVPRDAVYGRLGCRRAIGEIESDSEYIVALAVVGVPSGGVVLLKESALNAALIDDACWANLAASSVLLRALAIFTFELTILYLKEAIRHVMMTWVEQRTSTQSQEQCGSLVDCLQWG